LAGVRRILFLMLKPGRVRHFTPLEGLEPSHQLGGRNPSRDQPQILGRFALGPQIEAD